MTGLHYNCNKLTADSTKKYNVGSKFIPYCDLTRYMTNIVSVSNVALFVIDIVIEQITNCKYTLPIPECSIYFYGRNCNKPCGHCRGNDPCDSVTGHCPNGCQNQWTGDRCDGTNETV